MKTQLMASLVGVLGLFLFVGCNGFPKEQGVLNNFLGALSQGHYKEALSYCYGAEHIRFKDGLNLIYFKAVPPDGRTPTSAGGPSELDDYPDGIAPGDVKSVWSWQITGLAEGVDLDVVAPRAPVGCYVLKTPSYGLIGFVQVHKKPKICFIVFTRG